MEKENLSNHREFYIVVDGLDGIGKGEIERALIEYEQKLGRTTFDSISFSRANRKLPELKDFWDPPERYYNTIIVAEPTYFGIGDVIRNEIINKKNKGKYSSEIEIEAYCLDGLVLMNRVIIPALENGVRVISSRSRLSTLTYQIVRAQEEGKDIGEIKSRILAHEGTKLQLANRPDLIIIPTINDVKKLQTRLTKRSMYSKNDNSIFEDIEFQKKLKPLYESKWLRKIFEERGSIVRYLDAGISPELTRKQARDIYKEFLHKMSIKNKAKI